MTGHGLRLIREFREVLAPISQEGTQVKEIQSTGHGGHVSAIEFPKGLPRPEVFTPSTVILKGGYGVWELAIPSHVRRSLIDATLRIETIRTHGMLHSPKQHTSASVFVNDKLVDKIYLVRPHPHGEDFGVDSRRPFPILRYIDKTRDLQTVRIEVDPEVSWDIDRISIEPVVLTWEITPGAAMVVGAIISAILGGLVGYFLQYVK
jgi:hypothetical protein